MGTMARVPYAGAPGGGGGWRKTLCRGAQRGRGARVG